MDDTDELIRKIIGGAMKVHRFLRNGFQEKIYCRALAVKLKLRKISFEREKSMQIIYEGHEIGVRRVDFYVDNKIMIEIKAVETLEGKHMAQALNYLEIYNLKSGLLINFGSKSLQFKRLYNNKLDNLTIQ
jgi:GxxExxY protein